MRVALVHDWLTGMRGGEKVLEALLQLFPEATLFTLFHDPVRVSGSIGNHPIVCSWLNRVPGIYAHYRRLLPLFPAAVESFDLSGFDLIVSSSHAVAKGVRTGNVPHLCYCHTPMRYIWDAEADYRFGPLERAALGFLRDRLRRWDRETSARVRAFAVNSRFVQERVRSAYARESSVIHPPADLSYFSPDLTVTRGTAYLTVGLAPYKRPDLVLGAFERTGRRLIVLGRGETHRVSRHHGSNIEFRGWVPDAELRTLLRTSRALVTAAREEFGIATVEALACGCPVVAFGEGGVTDIVTDSVHGILYSEQTEDSIIDAIERFETRQWPLAEIQTGLGRFSLGRFQSQFQDFIRENVPASLR